MKLTDTAHTFIKKHLNEGGICLDATAGNGWDALFMAQIITSKGKLFCFDIQKEAIQSTKQLLSKHNCLRQTRLIQSCHTKIESVIDNCFKGKLSVATFNLGYLPTGDHSITTTGDKAVEAIKIAFNWLNPDGVMSIVAYRGHSGGELEARKVENHIENNSWKYTTVRCSEKSTSPILFLIKKSERVN